MIFPANQVRLYQLEGYKLIFGCPTYFLLGWVEEASFAS